MIDGFRDDTGLEASSSLQPLIDVAFQEASGHIRSSISVVRLDTFFAVALKVRLDGARLDQTETDW